MNTDRSDFDRQQYFENSSERPVSAETKSFAKMYLAQSDMLSVLTDAEIVTVRERLL